MAQPDLLGIIVSDMAASLRFYRLLGLDIPSDVDVEGHVQDPLVSSTIAQMKNLCFYLKILGSYPRADEDAGGSG